MSKSTYWITTTNGVHGQVTGTEERDRWTPMGWVETDEPKATDFVWMRREGLDQPAQFAYGAAETWQQMGWEFSPPPEPVDVTKDPQLFDQPKPKTAPRAKPKPADKPAEKTGSSTTTTEPAAADDEN